YEPNDLFGHRNLPVNCVSWRFAQSYCQARGADLPSQAQFEYVAGNLASHQFPWGDDVPRCSDAVFSRAGFGAYAAEASGCLPPGDHGGPLRVGPAGRLDVVTPGGDGAIYDLAGNIGEVLLDRWNEQDEPCWGVGVFHDAPCDQPSVRHPKARAA